MLLDKKALSINGLELFLCPKKSSNFREHLAYFAVTVAVTKIFASRPLCKLLHSPCSLSWSYKVLDEALTRGSHC